MIQFENVSFKYENAEGGSLDGISLRIKRGECVLLCGQSGCGKTTLTRLINGLIPHYYEGELQGRVTVGGSVMQSTPLYDTARTVGSVFQNPRSQFFCVDTTGEIAFGCENMGMPPEEIDRRVALAASEMSAENLLGRSIFQLSGGEKQKIACASVSAMQPQVIVLDEPTSNLDIDAIWALKRTLAFWKAQGKTIVIAEHRLYWLTELCDRVIYLCNGGIEQDMSMAEFCGMSAQALQSLGLRTRSLESLQYLAPPQKPLGTFTLKGYRHAYRGSRTPVLNLPELALPKGGVIAIIGSNGAGKSTFSKCLCGLQKWFGGKCCCDGTAFSRRQMLKKSYLVMQDVNHQLFCESVAEELHLGMSKAEAPRLEAVMEALALTELKERHPMSLSGGQKQRVAIASALLAGKEFLVFDEPTSGLDFHHMEQTAALLSQLGGEKTVLIVTHDPELIVRCCSYVLHLAQGGVAAHYALDAQGLQKLKQFFKSEEKERTTIEA